VPIHRRATLVSPRLSWMPPRTLSGSAGPPDVPRNGAFDDQGRAAAHAVLSTVALAWNAERRDITQPFDARTIAAITVVVNKLGALAAEIRECA
jgi:hypothetical protein